MKIKILQPSYIRKNGINIPFALNFYIHSTISDPRKRVIYIFHLCNIIDLKSISSNQLSDEFLLEKIFKETDYLKIVPKVVLRESTDLTDQKTFNKYFDSHLINLDLKKNRTFTLRETYNILLPWVGDGNSWERLAAYTKKVLADNYFNGDFDLLELNMTNNIFTSEYYKAHDKIRPVDAYRLREEELGETLKNEENHCLEFFLYFFLIYKCEW